MTLDLVTSSDAHTVRRQPKCQHHSPLVCSRPPIPFPIQRGCPSSSAEALGNGLCDGSEQHDRRQWGCGGIRGFGDVGLWSNARLLTCRHQCLGRRREGRGATVCACCGQRGGRGAASAGEDGRPPAWRWGTGGRWLGHLNLTPPRAGVDIFPKASSCRTSAGVWQNALWNKRCMSISWSYSSGSSHFTGCMFGFLEQCD
jgi:hypothetical protein